MSDEALVGPADIARLAGVGRSAVSNWRRRYAAFPQPVAGTAASPLFAPAEVENWLRAQGKLVEVPLVERAWQELRASGGDDLRLAAALAEAGGRLAAGQAAPSSALAELAGATGPADAFEALLSRFAETRTRGAATVPPETTELMAALAAGAATVLDPACGTGDLLLAARDNGAQRVLGHDAAPDLARLAAVRLRFSLGEDGDPRAAVVRAGSAPLADPFPGVAADAVLCCPPSYPRAGDQDLDPADPRWVYGVPPRMEPELAWVQHALAHLAPGGLAVVLMPPAAAARRPGRRIRAQLLRRGALRAVIALPAPSQGAHLWLLHSPSGMAPESVLTMTAPDYPVVLAAWRRFTADPHCVEPGVGRAVPVIDLLDDEVDLSPARHLPPPSAEQTAERFTATRDGLTLVLGGLTRLVPGLRPAGQPQPRSYVTVAELARTGQAEVHQAPARADFADGSAPMLTVEDAVEGRPPSGRGEPGDRWITLRGGDIVVAADRDRLAARVVTDPGPLLGAVLGPGLTLLRVSADRLDPYFVAGALRSAANAQVAARQTGSSGRADIARAQVAQLPLSEQRAYGAAFRQADELEAAARSAAAMGASLTQLLADGIAGGTLEP